MEEGDFSKAYSNIKNNFNGTLYQQGRVFLDSDFNDQTKTTIRWQDIAAADTIGTGVAAIPADSPDGFKVIAAKVENGKVVKVSIMPGRAWVDGLLVYSHNENLGDNSTRIATYFQPPIQKQIIDVTTIGNNRDAVVLEVWREAVNAFQIPQDLYEPALGGPDTTERIYTATSFRLLRLDEGDNCDSIRNKLRDKTASKGKLSVRLQDPSITNSDCPVVKSRGFTGFEHGLYRIEVADVTNASPMFKWSQFNGGLVGRGYFDPTDSTKFVITGNQQAIKTSGLDSFYMETIEYNVDLGHWQITFGVPVTLNNDGELEISQSPMYGNAPVTSTQNHVFFRLWNDIKLISDYINPKELVDGIILQFDDPQAWLYSPRDYWTFPVRVGEVKTEPLINNKPPDGIIYHRVPLAILNWNTTQNIDFHSIEDCRKVFRPLTDLNTCCTFTVGDGKSSFGDFNSIKEAIDSLGNSGGEICILPGMHESDAIINGKNNIKIRGCGSVTRFSAQKISEPILKIIDCNKISIEDITFEAEGGAAIYLEGSDPKKLRDIEISQNTFEAQEYAIMALDGTNISIHNNVIYMVDEVGAGVAIYMFVNDGKIQNNLLYAMPGGRGNNPSQAVGGIQILGGSNEIKITQNKIIGGSGNGITLSSINPLIQTADVTIPRSILSRITTSTIRNVLIQDNEITNMSLSGIGSRLTYSRRIAAASIINNPVINLSIIHNQINYCMQEPFTGQMLSVATLPGMGLGGISLELCENLYIIENNIENNGNIPSGSIFPICGIIISYVSNANIAGNYISGNGSFPTVVKPIFIPGLRAGIAVNAIALPVFDYYKSAGLYGLAGKTAIRVHDNVVDQPVGQALHIRALGSVSVQNNRLNSEYSTDKKSSEDGSEGSVYILNIGRTQAAGVTSPSAAISASSSFPDGNILFNNNQIRLGPKNLSAFSIWIISSDDVGFIGNQSDCLNSSLFVNSLLFGATIRATNNRFKETRLSIISAFTKSSSMNITTNNQGNNCIVAVNANAANLIDTGNQPEIGYCRQIKAKFMTQPGAGVDKSEGDIVEGGGGG